MISLLLGHLGSATGGAIMKALIGWLSESQRNKHETRLAELNQIEQAREAFHSADNYTKHTRRVLALLLVGTYCAILVLWALYPSAELITLFEPTEETRGYGVRLLGFDLVGLNTPANLENRLFTVTTGHLILSNSYLLSFVVGAYFMPYGRR